MHDNQQMESTPTVPTSPLTARSENATAPPKHAAAPPEWGVGVIRQTKAKYFEGLLSGGTAGKVVQRSTAKEVLVQNKLQVRMCWGDKE